MQSQDTDQVSTVPSLTNMQQVVEYSVELQERCTGGDILALSVLYVACGHATVCVLARAAGRGQQRSPQGNWRQDMLAHDGYDLHVQGRQQRFLRPLPGPSRVQREPLAYRQPSCPRVHGSGPQGDGEDGRASNRQASDADAYGGGAPADPEE